MNKKNAQALLSAQVNGFKIKFNSRYVDGFARLHMHEDGFVALNSSVYQDLNVEKVQLHEVSIYKEVPIEDFINWKDED